MIASNTHLRLATIVPHNIDGQTLQREGRIGFVVMIENTSAVPAQLPFFCFMDLGLNIEAMGDWQIDKITSDGRKLVRCSYRGIAPLLTARPAVACKLFLRVLRTGGIRVSFGAGPDVAPENLKDLKLFAISGAANFPAQRGQLLVQADTVRDYLQHVLPPPSAKLAS
jgi:hypothetical protein